LKDGCEISGVPACPLAAQLDAGSLWRPWFVGFAAQPFSLWPRRLIDLSDKVDGEVAHDGHVLGAMAFAQTGLIFTEDHVQRPMQLIFYAPMASDRLGGVLGGGLS
jgi:hypothetical protein